jgi:DNA-binding MarR family transcriptional regulator
MSFALTALILVHVDKHAGTWCALTWLAARLCVSQSAVKEAADALADAGQIQRMRLADGTHCYGVHIDCTGEAPVLRTVPV